MLEKARLRFSVHESGREIFYLDSVFRTSDESYDCIYTSMALHHVTELDTYLGYFVQILRPDGKLCIVDLTPDDGSFHGNFSNFDGHHGFDPSRLSEKLQVTGLQEEYKSVFFTDVRRHNDRDVPYSLFILIMKKPGSGK